MILSLTGASILVQAEISKRTGRRRRPVIFSSRETSSCDSVRPPPGIAALPDIGSAGASTACRRLSGGPGLQRGLVGRQIADHAGLKPDHYAVRLDAPLAELIFVPKASADSTSRTLAEAERDYIFDVLRETNWLVGGRDGAAMRLGVPRTTLIHKMHKLGIIRGSISASAHHTRRLSSTAPSTLHRKPEWVHAGGA